VMGTPATPTALPPDQLALQYQSAVQMSIYDGQLSWQVTGIFLQLAVVMAAGAIFPSFIGTDNRVAQALSGLAIAIAGGVLTAMFGSMTMRIRQYEQYWSTRAAELEGQMVGLGTFQGSARLASERCLTVGTVPLTMNRLYRIHTAFMMRTFYGLVLISFVAFIVLNGIRLRAAV
jgi:hypothetical protein